MNVFIKQEVADNYDQYYHTYTGAEIDRIEKQAIEALLPEASGGTILELGCGTGHWTGFLSSKGFRVIALDISEAMLAKANAKGIKNVEFLKGDAAALPFGNDSFGMILSITMLEFVDDLHQVMAEIYRVLQPDGFFIAGCLNLRSQLGKTKDKDDTFRNARFYTKEEINDLFKDWGNTEISESVFLSPSFEILDGTREKYPVEGAFLAVKVQKIRAK